MVGASSCEKDSVTTPSYCTLADVGECSQADGTPPSYKTGWGQYGQVASVDECWERCEHGSQTAAVTFWPAGWEGWTGHEPKCRCHETCAAFNATLVNASHPSWTAVRASMLPAGHTCDLPPSPPSPPAWPPSAIGPFYLGADFSHPACAGAPVREWSVPDIPTSASAADFARCISPYSNWSVHGEWCDFSAPAGPVLRGVYFANSSDCSTAGVGYGSVGTGLLADGAHCEEHDDGTSSRYKCVASVCATGDSAFCSSSHHNCWLEDASDTPSCYAGYVAGPSPYAPSDSNQYTCFPSHCSSCNASKCTSMGDDCWLHDVGEAQTCADGYQPAQISANMYTCCYDPTPRAPPSPPPPTAGVSAPCDSFNCYIDLERSTLPTTWCRHDATSQAACASLCCQEASCRGFEFRAWDNRCCATVGSRAWHSREHPYAGALSPHAALIPRPHLRTLAAPLPGSRRWWARAAARRTASRRRRTARWPTWASAYRQTARRRPSRTGGGLSGRSRRWRSAGSGASTGCRRRQ